MIENIFKSHPFMKNKQFIMHIHQHNNNIQAYEGCKLYSLGIRENKIEIIVVMRL